MGISIDSNLMAIKALNSTKRINADIETSIGRLSSGSKLLRAEDNASGMAIADSLNLQSKGLTEAVKNSNDAIGLVQVADGGLGQQIDILSKIRDKAVAAANDVHSKLSIDALQQDVAKLLDELNNIAETTTYNGLSILSGNFVNKDFHTGADSKSFVRLSINSSQSKHIGITRYETGSYIKEPSTVRFKIIGADGKSWILDEVIISHSASTGISQLAELINKNRDTLGVRASYTVESTSFGALKDGVIEGLEINGIFLGNIDITGIKGKETLVKTINSMREQTGITSNIDVRGHLNLRSLDGRGIVIKAEKNAKILELDGMDTPNGHKNYGRMTLVKLNNAKDILISGVNYTATGFNNSVEAQSTVRLDNLIKDFTIEQTCAMGAYANPYAQNLQRDKTTNTLQPGLLTSIGAQVMLDSIDIALKNLQDVRGSIAATQNQLSLTIDSIKNLNNNIRASESQLRDTNYAVETTALNTNKILLQANIFSLAKSKAIRDLVLELLR
jgi:flagellin